MNAINKIHFNSSTGVSLNDRFTVISRISPLNQRGSGGAYERNGAKGILRKRSNSVDSYASRGSYANRQFLNQLDRRHIGQSQAALRLRNRTIRSGRQRLNRSSFASRTQLRRAAGNTLSLSGGSRRLQRSNSFTDVATMNADYVERQALRRSNSQLSIASRLGGRSRGGPRRPLQRTYSSSNLTGRGRSQSRGRSRSRSRSRTRLPRSRSRGNNFTRTRSRSAGLNGNGYNNGYNSGYNNGYNNSYNNNRIENRLGRGGGRMRGRPNMRRGRGGGLTRAASRSNLRTGSVNGRLGGNRTNRPLGTRVGRGRVAKRGLRRGPAGPGQNGTGGGRPGRTLQRRGGGARGGAGGPLAAGGARRGRSRSRGRAVSQNRGRSAQRGGRNASRGRRASAPTMSKEQLDNELDQYMANTKFSLDKEMDEYMNGINSSV